MSLLALAITLAVSVFGLIGVVDPQRLLAVLRSLQSTRGLYGIAAVRVVYGLALYGAASQSQSPRLLAGLGIFVVIAGLVTPLFGVERFRAITNWLYGLGAGFVRVWGGVALVFLLWIAYLIAG